MSIEEEGKQLGIELKAIDEEFTRKKDLLEEEHTAKIEYLVLLQETRFLLIDFIDRRAYTHSNDQVENLDNKLHSLGIDVLDQYLRIKEGLAKGTITENFYYRTLLAIVNDFDKLDNVTQQNLVNEGRLKLL